MTDSIEQRMGPKISLHPMRSTLVIIQGGIWMAAIGLLLLGQIVAPLVVVPLALLLGALSLRLSANRPLPPVPPAAAFNWRDKTGSSQTRV